ncbi:hypothetical protein Bca52824_016595 [Brassica carinata]|uniref:Uncharacterized protein n=1 Tax=Brassica carinata TaxID=52824 RepID=A0A8X8B6T7_BRACI|nr:hypothetical protein Bca52824_016595 [Brassica carinata]
MSTPPTLTVTNQQAAQPPINTPAFRTFFSLLSTSIRDGLSQRSSSIGTPWRDPNPSPTLCPGSGRTSPT